MGNANSVKGLKMLETIYPTADKKTIFADPKMKKKLDKELAKDQKQGKPPPVDPNAGDEQPVDGNQDALIDKCVRAIWETYDPKNHGFLDKKIGTKFFIDAFEIYAYRKGQKPKEALPPGNNMKKAAETCFTKMNKSGNQKITFQEFEEYINVYELDEALEPFTNQSGVNIDVERVDFVNVEQFRGQKKDGPKLVYRNYG
mmetsp:Transcript_27343/g.30456  ORF Transcript_27343/g.30456 Transcript_27343/m.30456 type:complete len:200 (+) Transcript_27343:33-632(+)|eukprot:CAMPEP_0168523182 /NCGR_PEP_ID=MMETSP0405-20121227/9817_1 /TAXON_ID=498012 /ORGANISM="Trichosphaerium sp, Strain Am-I-7 wt" /LENGTH=199 /DNA_ID=CAMNT_0008544979 /DNA_START=27 /DNA_END=626 /DNA_ORIENTATION=+